MNESRSPAPAQTERVSVGLIGAGAMGAYHADTLAHRLPGARLAGIADPLAGLAESAALGLGCSRWETDSAALIDDPAVDAIVIATPAPTHADLIAAATAAGKAVFCEKPLAYDLEAADRAIEAARRAGVPLQVGFQRRFDVGFRDAHDLASSGRLGSIQLLRSLTRDPSLDRPERVPPWAVFRETLIHDFDILRWLAGSEPVEVFARADALVRPDFKQQGLLDTAVVIVRFANGAMATADASFQAVYGYDVRAEVFGSAGMATVGEGRRSTMTHFTHKGAVQRRVSWFVDLFGAAYTAELADFVDCLRTRRQPACTGEDGRAALAIALAAIQSVETGRPVSIAEVDPPRG